MENNKPKGIFISIGVVSLLLGILIGYGLGNSNNSVSYKSSNVGDFRVGQGFQNRGQYGMGMMGFGLGASTIYSFDQSGYTERVERIIFYPSDCTNLSVINRYSRELDFAGFRDFENYCESIGSPLG